MMDQLALLGGPKTIDHGFEAYNTIGEEEIEAVTRVMRTGVLSKFLGCWDDDFFGGIQVQNFERAWEAKFRCKHAVSVNSNTSGLIAALGAVGVAPGDEVIVSPWTMAASATAILVWNAIPVFADIEEDTFNLSVDTIRKQITPHTTAIMVTDIFGHAAAMDEIMELALKHDLKVIEDSAQAPGAIYHERFAGTIAHVGVFSLNYHKHIHTGEGGVCVTNDALLAERLQLIRNHGEVVVAEKPGCDDISNIIGFNFRLTEIQAAIGIEQLKKLDHLVKGRISVADQLHRILSGLPGLQLPKVKPHCNHVYYTFPLIVDNELLGVSAHQIAEALTAEGVPGVFSGYQNIHLLPMYQRRIAHGKNGFPWKSEFYRGKVSYSKGICPVAEDLHENRFLGLQTCLAKYETEEIELIGRAFKKVWANLSHLARTTTDICEIPA